MWLLKWNNHLKNHDLQLFVMRTVMVRLFFISGLHLIDLVVKIKYPAYTNINGFDKGTSDFFRMILVTFANKISSNVDLAGNHLVNEHSKLP
ncbi:hypothetical protein BTR25_25505 [Bacillus sp. MRMR6]|nr:hypothetical protein BTR25_25505 [Bacillus sp. MRMR6]